MPFDVDYDEYPILKQITYLDTPFEGLVSRSTWAYLHEHASQQTNDFLTHDAQWRYQLRDRTRDVLSKVVQLDVNEVALVPGFSVGLRALIPWLSRFRQVIMIEDDYPTMLDAFAVGGFELTFLPRQADGSFSLEDLAFAMEKNKGGLFACSHVHNISGFKIQEERVAALAEANGVTTLMDITQSFGSMPLDLANTGMDVTVCSPYKWSGAGFGIGFVTVRTSCEKLKGAIEQLNTGHLDPYAMLRFQHALSRSGTLGLKAIWHHIEELNDQLCVGLKEKNVTVHSNRSITSRSAIIQFEGSEALQEELLAQGIRTSYRGTGIRVGMHWYNNAADVSKLLEAL